jgi:hypothetical protein
MCKTSHKGQGKWWIDGGEEIAHPIKGRKPLQRRFKEIQTNLLGFEIRNKTKRKICQVLMEQCIRIFSRKHQT